MISIAGGLGTFVFGLMGIYVLTWLVEKFGGRESPPRVRATRSIAIALALMALLRTLFFGGDLSFFMLALLVYLPSAVVIWLLHVRRLEKAWDNPDQTETFR